MLISYKGGQKFRETFYQFMTAFSLPWYAAIGVQAALSAGLPDIAAIFIGVVGPTAGRFLIDITAGPLGQAVRPRRVVRRHGRAHLVRYLICAKYFGLTDLAGHPDRVSWLASSSGSQPCGSPGKSRCRKLPPHVVGEVARRETLKEKMPPDWEPKYE